MDQKTMEWLKWRQQGIGSSDVSAILGISPWKTAYKLWQEKIADEVKESEGNWAMRRGNEEEPKVRAMFELQMGEAYAPALCMMAGLNFMRSSLDGRSADRKSIIEIKFAGKVDHEGARTGLVPDKYMAQIQHQLLVSMAEVCHYLSWNGKELLRVDVKPDQKWQDRIRTECIAFWRCVMTKTPPGMQDSDSVPLQNLDDKVNKWKELKSQVDALSEVMEGIEAELKAAVTVPRMHACGVTFSQVERIGNVNYKAIPELKNVDLEKYRGKPSSYIKISIAKEA